MIKSVGRRGRGEVKEIHKEVKEAVSRKKDAHRAMCQNSTEENKSRYKKA